MTVAALFVETDGVYFDLPGVDPWDLDRDARTYAGPHPVVAHPPCKRWGNYATGSMAPGSEVKTLGDDGGCFAAALHAVRIFGGVLEHPARSRAWSWFGLSEPGRVGWRMADNVGGWACCVEQGAYGHRAPKSTWLYAAKVELPSLEWGSSGAEHRVELMGRRERLHTPRPFADLLLSIARSATTAGGRRKRAQ